MGKQIITYIKLLTLLSFCLILNSCATYCDDKCRFVLMDEFMISFKKECTTYNHISYWKAVLDKEKYEYIKFCVTLPPRMKSFAVYDGSEHYFHFAHQEQIFIYAPYLEYPSYKELISSSPLMIDEGTPHYKKMFDYFYRGDFFDYFKNKRHHRGVNRFIVKDNFVVYLYHIRKKHLETYTNMVLNSLRTYPPLEEDTLKADTITIYNGQ